MNTSANRRLLFIFLAVLAVVAAIAIVKRDTIADIILRGGDISLSDEAARNSPQAKLAVDFLTAFRAMDKDAIARVATAELVARIEQESAQSPADFQKMRAMMLQDLPADPAALRSHIKTMQVHKDRAVVLAETKTNSWFVQLAQERGAWKVSGF